MAQSVKSVPAMLETRVQFLSQEDPLEKKMATIPVFLPGQLHGQRSLVGINSLFLFFLFGNNHFFLNKIHFLSVYLLFLKTDNFLCILKCFILFLVALTFKTIS